MFKGIFPALITPYTKDNVIDDHALKSLCKYHLQSEVDGIVVLGTTGESPTLESFEEKQILETVLEQAKGKVPIIAGCASNNTESSYRKAQLFKEIGVDAVMAIVPYYNKPNEEGVYKHFKRICQADIPVVVYHHPGRTGITLSVSCIEKIMEMDEVASLKECFMRDEIFERVKKPILCGNDLDLLKMMKKGAKGSISVVANLFPSIWKKIVSKADKDLFNNMSNVIRVLEKDVNPQTIKYALSLFGFCNPNLRLPLVECREEIKKEIKEAIYSFGVQQQDLFGDTLPLDFGKVLTNSLG